MLDISKNSKLVDRGKYDSGKDIDDGVYVFRMWLDSECEGYEYVISIINGKYYWCSGYDSNIDSYLELDVIDNNSLYDVIDNFKDSYFDLDFNLFKLS